MDQCVIEEDIGKLTVTYIFEKVLVLMSGGSSGLHVMDSLELCLGLVNGHSMANKG